MYFDDLLLNVLVIIVYITLMTLLNMYLNKHARLLMNYSSKLNLTNEDFIKKYNLDNKVNISVSPSSGGNDLDGYFKKDKLVFINARHIYSNSIYSISRLTYLLSFSKVENSNSFKFYNVSNMVMNILDALSIGLIFIGLLLKINLLITIGLCLIGVSFILVLVNYNFIKKVYDEALKYLSNIIYKEKDVYKVLYRFELISFLFRPILGVVKLFPFLLSKNQKALRMGESHYE